MKSIKPKSLLAVAVMTIAVVSALFAVGATFAVSAAPAAWVTANHVSLRYRIDGSGDQVVVLLQESGLPLEAWDDFMPHVAGKHRRILRYDPRGVGLSEKFRSPITMQDEVDDLAALLDALSITQPVSLVGGALGGSIALQFAAQHPERVKGLVVTSPSAVTQTKPPRPRVNPVKDPQGYIAAGERTLDVTYPQRFRGDEAKWQRLRAMESVNDFDSEVLTEALINTTDFSQVLPRIRCPTLIIATSVFPRPVESVKALADQIPNAEFVVIESGHLAAYQTPELVAPLLRKFLQKVER